jgi:hypothetical protein
MIQNILNTFSPSCNFFFFLTFLLLIPPLHSHPFQSALPHAFSPLLRKFWTTKKKLIHKYIRYSCWYHRFSLAFFSDHNQQSDNDGTGKKPSLCSSWHRLSLLHCRRAPLLDTMLLCLTSLLFWLCLIAFLLYPVSVMGTWNNLGWFTFCISFLDFWSLISILHGESAKTIWLQISLISIRHWSIGWLLFWAHILLSVYRFLLDNSWRLNTPLAFLPNTVKDTWLIHREFIAVQRRTVWHSCFAVCWNLWKKHNKCSLHERPSRCGCSYNTQS